MAFKDTRYGVCTPGFRASGVKRGKYGVALILSDRICPTACIVTKNSVKAESVSYTSKILKNGLQAVVVNSGNANCCVDEGMAFARDMGLEASKRLGVDVKNTAVASTGVIGKPMDISVVKALILEASTKLSSSSKGSIQAAKAIMTTDRIIKMYSAEKNGLKVGAICKGAGMIAPNMATMLCFATTNAKMSQKALDAALRKAADVSFNMISVDGEMSTNDTIMLMSSDERACKPDEFEALLSHVLKKLAKMIAQDGEGATKLIEVTVEGARKASDARAAVSAVTGSPLFKCAMYGSNPNWGRIVSAIGAVLNVDYKRMEVSYEGGGRRAVVLSNGKQGSLDMAHEILKNRSVKVHVSLGLGKESATGWGCDMSEEYVRVNAEYN
jgi:glutamate N-acetyltransferase / amino-acid N-acetyltransferase